MNPLTYDPLDPAPPVPPPLRLVTIEGGRLQYVPAETPRRRWLAEGDVVDWRDAPTKI